MKTRPPRATIALAVAIGASFLLFGLSGQSGNAAMLGGFIPARVLGPALPGALPVVLTPLSATLLHGGLLHIAFNLLMLGYCGRETEVALGPAAVGILFAVGAYVSAAFQYLVDPGSTVPMIGASGAISALVGAYALLYGKRRPSRLPAAAERWLHVAWLAAAWIGLQVLVGVASLLEGMAIATAAHVGGFLAGLLLARPLLLWRYRRA